MNWSTVVLQRCPSLQIMFFQCKGTCIQTRAKIFNFFPVNEAVCSALVGTGDLFAPCFVFLTHVFINAICAAFRNVNMTIYLAILNVLCFRLFCFSCFAEYTDDEAHIPKHSSVIVRRTPIGGVKPAGRTFIVYVYLKYKMIDWDVRVQLIERHWWTCTRFL